MQRVLVFNHPSWVDSIILLFLFAPSGVSRDANLKIPVVGRIIYSFQNIYVPSPRAQPQRSEALDEVLVAPKSTTELILDRCAWPLAVRGVASDDVSCLLCIHVGSWDSAELRKFETSWSRWTVGCWSSCCLQLIGTCTASHCKGMLMYDVGC